MAQRDIKFVGNHCASEWSRSVLADLREACGLGGMGGGVVGLGKGVSTTKGDKKIELRKDAKIFQTTENKNMLPHHLSLNNLQRSYNSTTTSRVIILDYGGTLLSKEAFGKYVKRDVSATSGRKPRRILMDSLLALASNPQNHVFVVTGTSVSNLEMVFPSPNFTSLNLGAADGKSISWATSNVGIGSGSGSGSGAASPTRHTVINTASGTHRRAWTTESAGVLNWPLIKKVCLPILSKYAARTNGSSVTVKVSATTKFHSTPQSSTLT